MTIARRLWLAFGLLGLIVTATGLLVYAGVQATEDSLRQVVRVDQPANAAAYEMEINTVEIEDSVRRYLDDGDMDARERLRVDTEEFERFKDEYDRSTTTPEGREAGRRVGELYEEYSVLIEGIIDRADESEALEAGIAEDFDRMDALLDKDLQRGATSERERLATSLEADLAEVRARYRAYIDGNTSVDRGDALANAEDIRGDLAALRALEGLSAGEKDAVDELERRFEGSEDAVERAITASEAQDRDLAEFGDLRTRMDAVLDDEIQVLTVKRLRETEEAAQSATQRAGRALVLMFLVGLVVGSGAAYLIGRGIVRSINRLVEGANRIGSGDLSHRLGFRGYDEVGQLARAMDEMAEKRQEAEKEVAQLARRNGLILNTAGEGIYGLDLEEKTTFMNPAAARMLGWSEKEMLGRHQHDMIHHTKPDGTPYELEECPIYRTLLDADDHQVTNDVFWRKDGTSFPVEYLSKPVVEDGKVVGAVVTFRDVTERRAAEEELRASEERNRAVVDTAPDAILTMSQDGRIRSFNRGAEVIFGHTVAEAVGRPMKMLMPQRFHAPHDAGYHSYLNGREAHVVGKGPVEVVGVRKSGEEFPLELALGEMREGGERVFVGVIRDVSARKEAEESLRRSEERYRLVARTTNEVIWESDLLTGELRWNGAVEDIFGYAPEDVRGGAWWEDRLHPDDRERVLQRIEEAIEGTDEVWSDEYRFERGDAPGYATVSDSAFVVREEGAGGAPDRAVRIVGSMRDVTERRRAEEDLRESERRFSTLIRNIPAVVYRCVNEPDWPMEFVSKHALELTGYPAKDFVGGMVSFDELILEGDQERVWDEVRAALRAGLFDPAPRRLAALRRGIRPGHPRRFGRGRRPGRHHQRRHRADAGGKGRARRRAQVSEPRRAAPGGAVYPEPRQRREPGDVHEPLRGDAIRLCP